MYAHFKNKTSEVGGKLIQMLETKIRFEKMKGKWTICFYIMYIYQNKFWEVEGKVTQLLKKLKPK